MGKKAVVFGATGLTGQELIFELLADQDFTLVIGVARRPLPLAHSKLETLIVNDFSNLSDYKEILTADVYFCCIGTTIKTAGTKEIFHKVDYDIPVIIAKQASEYQIPDFVIISSIGADAHSSNFYLKTKGEMEDMVKSIYSGNLKIVRPSLIMGHRAEFRLGEKIAVVLMKVLGIFFIGTLKKYKGIQTWDLAHAMIKSTDLPKETIFVESDRLHQLSHKNITTNPKHDIIK